MTQASAADLAALSALCLRSKAYWNYDAAFLEACRSELTLSASDLDDAIAVTRQPHRFTGIVQVALLGQTATLERLFIEPDLIGQGLGKALLHWAVDQARSAGALQLRIEADPGAAPFYLAQNATQIGSVPSGSIPGRQLPLLRIAL